MVSKGVSTWSLHRTLESFKAPGPTDGEAKGARHVQVGQGLSLLDLGAELHSREYQSVQICHFQLPTRDPSYLDELSASMRAAGVTIDALLIDDGDLSHPSEAAVHQRWIQEWADDAEALGADRARVVAGKQQPSPATIRQSADHLRQISAAHSGIRIVTENWFSLLSSAQPVHDIMELTAGEIGFLLDFGNWTGDDKYRELESIAALAESCHAKCHFTDDVADREDFARVTKLLTAAGYDERITLVYDGQNDAEWDRLEIEWEIVQASTS